MAGSALPDPTAQPQIDPAVLEHVKALIALHQAQQTANLSAPSTNLPPGPMSPEQMGPPTLPAPTPTLQPGAPTPTPSLATPGAPPSQPNPMQQAAPNLPPPPPGPDVTQAPGPIKRTLTNFLYGAGQALVKHAGLETDAEHQARLASEGVAQQNADTNSGYKDLQGQLLQQQTAAASANLAPMQIPDLPAFGGLAGKSLPTSVAVPLMQKVLGYQSAADIAAGKNAVAANTAQLHYGTNADGSIPYLRRGFANVGGRFITYDRADPIATRQDMGPSNSLITAEVGANARAAAMAKYRTFDTVDGEGNPVTISGLDALQGGAAHTPYAQAKGLASDKVGIQQYDQILSRIQGNLSALNDNGQRAVIAHTLDQADKNPGMIQSIITSGLQSGSLTPQGAQLAADIMQGREFGGVARKYGGNMNGTEGLMNRIMANQASPLNSQQLNTDLITNDKAFTKKAMTVVGGLTKHNAGATGGPPNTAPANNQAQSTPSNFFSQFGGVPVKP